MILISQLGENQQFRSKMKMKIFFEVLPFFGPIDIEYSYKKYSYKNIFGTLKRNRLVEIRENPNALLL